MKLVDLTGQRFGRLTVIRRCGTAENLKPTWLCQCDCGNKKIVRGSDLKSGKQISCGCRRKEGTHLIHGKTNERIHRIWANMKTRCTNANIKAYKDYGGRGITVCDEWLNSFESFYKWSIENGYSDNLTLDRIDADGNYCPENCRWATMKEQQRNRTNNRRITYNGETHTVADWSIITGIHRATINSRLKSGWTIEKTLTTKGS